ncbi:DUF2125 domain-containing protein [Paracoccus ravus]|uniref:DUF2125 domain-containing protein n=1 Tax=Paracoccus ravus TaxID=2447760 RepID=UPI00106E3F7A|nr:DUF2125 domain-containing protein [Paracoccus ravus]
MRRFIILIAIVAGLLIVFRIGAERILLRELGKMAEAGTGFTAEAIAPLGNPLRLGARLTAPRIETPSGSIAMDAAEISVSLLSPMTARLRLGDTVTADLGAGPHRIGLVDPQASLSVMPLRGFAPDRLAVTTGALRLEDQDFTGPLSLIAVVSPTETTAPRASAAAYDLDLKLAEIQPGALAQLTGLPSDMARLQPLALDAALRVWLDALPTARALQQVPTPFPTGLRLDRVTLQSGPIGANLIGRLEADSTGRAMGALALYTADIVELLRSASDAGLIPKAALLLGQGMVGALSKLPLPDGPDGPYPAAQPGELRLPVSFADGKTALGPIPLGPAPLLRP